jgi:cytosine/adenosine deaminase-related metal-dependent hydrolase
MAAAELMLSGCTTASDRHSIFPNDCTLDRQIQVVQEIGIRFHASRGSLSKSISQGGLAPDRVVENKAAISICLRCIFAQVGIDSCAAMVYRCAPLIQRSQHL